MRNLIDVIDACLREIPDGEGSQYDYLRHRAAWIKDTIGYTAPEVMGERWWDWVHTLQSALEDTDTPWKEEIGRIMRGEVGPPYVGKSASEQLVWTPEESRGRIIP